MPTEIIIQLLYKRLIGGRLTADESDILERWIGENPELRKPLVDGMSDIESVSREYRIRERIDSDRACRDMCRRLGMDSEEEVTIEKRRKWKIPASLLKYAAAIAAIAVPAACLLFFNTDASAPNEAESTADVRLTQRPVELASLAPGSTQAVMTLPDGDTIRLSEPGTATNAGITEGRLQLEVPRGGEFAIVLEDSTKVWLNSDSKLYYPAHFSSSERNVELLGEAYFEVSHQADRPFVVETSGQKVTVYGTEFNIRSYPEDSSVYTTLSTGSIGLSRADGSGAEIRLSPGKQAVFDKETSSARVRQVDIDRVTGWRHGRFVFEEQSLLQIMRDLSRWYDFDFEFADEEVAETIFMGSIPRYSNFKTAIAILEKSGGLVFSVKDNKVVVAKE